MLEIHKQERRFALHAKSVMDEKAEELALGTDMSRQAKRAIVRGWREELVWAAEVITDRMYFITERTPAEERAEVARGIRMNMLRYDDKTFETSYGTSRPSILHILGL